MRPDSKQGARRKAAAKSRRSKLEIVTSGAAKRKAMPSHYSVLDERKEPNPAIANASSAVQGTVGATITTAELHDYSSTSEMLVRSEPLAALKHLVQSESSGPTVRAADLAAELNLINAEIHRIMAQVEKAVARLVTSG